MQSTFKKSRHQESNFELQITALIELQRADLREIVSLRRAIAQKYAELHNVEVDPATEIVVTTSGVQALNVTIRCTIDPGDEALILTPNWPNGSEIIRMYGATPVEVPLITSGERFAIRADFDPIGRSQIFREENNFAIAADFPKLASVISPIWIAGIQSIVWSNREIIRLIHLRLMRKHANFLGGRVNH